MASPRFIILELKQAKALAEAASGSPALLDVRNRIASDLGGSLTDVALMLKSLALCDCCVQADMAHACSSLQARRHGRRLQNLLDKAQGKVAPVPEGSRPGSGDGDQE